MLRRRPARNWTGTEKKESKKLLFEIMDYYYSKYKNSCLSVWVCNFVFSFFFNFEFVMRFPMDFRWQNSGVQFRWGCMFAQILDCVCFGGNKLKCLLPLLRIFHIVKKHISFALFLYLMPTSNNFELSSSRI